jgi:hypothetical protein
MIPSGLRKSILATKNAESMMCPFLFCSGKSTVKRFLSASYARMMPMPQVWWMQKASCPPETRSIADCRCCALVAVGLEALLLIAKGGCGHKKTLLQAGRRDAR